MEAKKYIVPLGPNEIAMDVAVIQGKKLEEEYPNWHWTGQYTTEGSKLCFFYYEEAPSIEETTL